MLPVSFAYENGYKHRFKTIHMNGETYAPLYREKQTGSLFSTPQSQLSETVTPKYDIHIDLKANKVTIYEGKSARGFLAKEKGKLIITERNPYIPMTAKEYLNYCQSQYQATNKTIGLAIDIKAVEDMQIALKKHKLVNLKNHQQHMQAKLLNSMHPHQPSHALEKWIHFSAK